MKTLYQIQALSLFLYIGGMGFGVCLFILVDRLFSIQLPTWILAFIVLICLIISATLRLFVWRKRNSILTKEEQKRFGTNVFFLTAYFEVFAAIIGTIIVFS